MNSIRSSGLWPTSSIPVQASSRFALQGDAVCCPAAFTAGMSNEMLSVVAAMYATAARTAAEQLDREANARELALSN